MIKLPKIEYKCNSDLLYLILIYKLYSFSVKSDNVNKAFYINYNKYCQEYLRIGLTSKSIYIENDEYCLIYLFDKLTNEEFLNTFINWRLHSLSNIFGNLYLVEFGA